MSLSQIFRDFDNGREDEPDERISSGGLLAGEIIGNYTLVNPIGEGGFGSVWRAIQERPVRRDVALKILKPGMDSEEILGRFEQERQAMAMMDHPNIAMVFDAGSAPSGRPFVAMELISDGVPITEYCADKELAVEDRLSLFIPVCDAIQHAHRKGILHRDIKPSNILVSPGDAQKVKVIDFGIAKAIGTENLTSLPIRTRLDRLIGTPAYMSPEQLSRSGDIDTRSDVYSLGVVLYELLTGSLPFDDAELVRDLPPRKPSHQISPPGEDTRKRRESRLRGDLDCIALKALDPARDRRYDSPAQLGQDLKRHLAHEPILARPESGFYVAKRFAQRNKAAVLGLTGVIAALVIGFTVSTIAFLRENEARRSEAVQSERNQQITGFLTDILAAAGVSKALGRDATMLREILNEASGKIEKTPNLAPEVEWELRNIIGNVFLDLDDYPQGSIQFERALELLKNLESPADDDLATVIFNLARASELRGNVKKAEPLLHEAIALLQSDSEANRNQLHRAKTLLAWIYLKSGRAAQGEDIAKEAYLAWRDQPGDRDLLDNAPVTYATILILLGRKQEGEDILREELRALREIHDGHHPDIATCLGNLGRIILLNGKPEEAQPILNEALAHGRHLHGEKNPHQDQILTNLAKIEGLNQNFPEEQRLAREAVLAARRTFEPGHRYRRQTSRFYEKVLLQHSQKAFDRKDLTWLERCQTLLDELAELAPEITVNRELPKQLQSDLLNAGAGSRGSGTL